MNLRDLLEPTYLAIAVAVVWYKVAEVGKQLTDLRKDLNDHRNYVTDIDHKFWSEKWPKVEALVPKVEAIADRVDDLADRVQSLEQRQA